MPPKFDPFASNLKELFQYQSTLPEGDGLSTRQRLREQRREEVRQRYNAELPLREKHSAAGSIIHNKSHQQLDELDGRPLVSNLVGGKYYERAKAQPVAPPVTYMACDGEADCPTCGAHRDEPLVSSATRSIGSSAAKVGGTTTSKPSQAPEEVSTQTKEWHRLPYPVDDRQGTHFKLGPKPVAVQTSASGRTVRNVGVEVTPDELYQPKPPAPWDKVPEETKKGRAPVTKDLHFVAERTIQTETDLQGRYWDRELRAENAGRPLSAVAVMANDRALPEKVEAPAGLQHSPRPVSAKQRFQHRPLDTMTRLF